MKTNAPEYIKWVEENHKESLFHGFKNQYKLTSTISQEQISLAFQKFSLGNKAVVSHTLSDVGRIQLEEFREKDSPIKRISSSYQTNANVNSISNNPQLPPPSSSSSSLYNQPVTSSNSYIQQPNKYSSTSKNNQSFEYQNQENKLPSFANSMNNYPLNSSSGINSNEDDDNLIPDSAFLEIDLESRLFFTFNYFF